MKQITPIAQLDRRMPTAGRIRIGQKKPGSRFPQKLSTFRFTSEDKEALEQIAAMYGGDVHPWKDAPSPNQFEVITQAKEIRIALPPNALGESPIYELWSGGGCLRRCDGIEAQVPQVTGEGAEMGTVPCICDAKQDMQCKPKTRLTVILRGVRFGGGWRLESGGWNTAQEMPGMVDAIFNLQKKGITSGLLRLTERKESKNGKTFQYVVPVLALEDDIDALAAGASTLGALAPAPETNRLGELGSGLESSVARDTDNAQELLRVGNDRQRDLRETVSLVSSASDESIADAEIVYEPDDPGRPFTEKDERPSENGPDNVSNSKLQTALVLKIKDLAEFFGEDETELRHAFAKSASKGTTTSTTQLTDEAKIKILERITSIEQGDWDFLGITDGEVQLVKAAQEGEASNA